MFHVKRRLFEEESGGEPEGGGGGAANANQDGGGQDLDALTTRLDQLAQGQGQNSQQLQQLATFFQQQQQAKPDDAQKQAALEEFFKDPARAAQMAGFQGAQAALQQQFQQEWPTRVEAAMEKVRAKNPETFDRFKDEIQQYARNYDNTLWTNPEVWNQAFNAAVVNHQDELFAERQKKRDQDGPAPPSLKGQKAQKKQEEEMTSDQREMAEVFGMTDQEWKDAEKGREQNKAAPETGRGMLKSKYADFIPLDSDDWKRRRRVKQEQKVA